MALVAQILKEPPMTNQPFNQPQDMVEAGLIASALSSEAHWLQVQSLFSADDFTSQGAIYRFIQQYQSQYGTLPSASQIGTRFDWKPPIGDFAYWLNETKRYVLARKVMEIMQEGYGKIGEPDDALGFMVERLSTLRSSQTNHIDAWDQSASERMEKYMARQSELFQAKRMVGLRTGMRIIDETGIGWMPGGLVGIYSRPGVGKTWWLIWQGIQTWMDGGTVLLIGPEMPANFLDLRVDVVAGDALGYPISYDKLLKGDPSVQENYQKIINIINQNQRWWTYDSINERSISLADIAALIRQHNPTLVLIDGISLLKPESSRQQTWEQIKELCYGLKTLATIHYIPIIATHQAVNSARGRRKEVTSVGRGDDFIMPSLNDSAFGDAFVQACSDIITMCGDPTTRFINWYSLRKYRERGWERPLPPRMAFAMNLGTGRIRDLSILGWNPESVGKQALTELELTTL